MSDINSVNIAGRLGADPEIRTTQSGVKVANISVGVKGRKERGAQENKTMWVKVTLWGSKADFAEGYLRRGTGVWVVGELNVSSYTDRSGQERKSWEVNADRVGFNGPKQDDTTPDQYSKPHQGPGRWQHGHGERREQHSQGQHSQGQHSQEGQTGWGDPNGGHQGGGGWGGRK